MHLKCKRLCALSLNHRCPKDISVKNEKDFGFSNKKVGKKEEFKTY